VIWASPAAWALAILAALPVVAHLWSRKRPMALSFPTLRFLRAASPVSRRLRRVQDWPLLLLRLAIVGVICAAAAGPTLSARWRQRAWQARLHRVIVVEAGAASASAAAEQKSSRNQGRIRRVNSAFSRSSVSKQSNFPVCSGNIVDEAVPAPAVPVASP